MDHASTNGYLTTEQFQALSAFEIDLAGLGKFRFRKIGSDELEAFYPMPPAAADDWPRVGGETDEAVLASKRARRQAEADYLRSLPLPEQIWWRTAVNNVKFHAIAACCKAPRFVFPPTTAGDQDPRDLGDAAVILFAAILTKSGLLKPEAPQAPPAVAETVEAPADAG